MNFGILITYLTAGIIQASFDFSISWVPILVLIGYHISLFCLLLILLQHLNLGKQHQFIIIVIHLMLVVILLTANSNFFILWDDGAVFIQNNPIADLGTLIMSIVIVSLTCFFAYIHRIKILGHIDDDVTLSMNNASISYLILGVSFFLQFFVPRAVNDSILNPLSVKFVGFVVTLSAIIALSLLDRFNIDDLKQIGKTDINLENIPGPSDTQMLVSICIILIGGLVGRYQPSYSDQSRNYLQSVTLYIGNINGINYYLHYTIILVLLSLGVFLINEIRIAYKKLKEYFTKNFTFFTLTGILCFSILVLTNIPYYVEEYALQHDRYQVIWGIIIAPILAQIIVDYFHSSRNSNKITLNISENRLRRITSIFIMTLVPALFADIIIISPLFGFHVTHIFIGAAGILDGLIWGPILAVTIFELTVSFKEMIIA
ncbi:MAG: hypothetical protein GF411_10775 [Candidatus Lokiarchaeota archaeon]|nr:hypothetical protein [Candidatus Lokiarchaeota archaeon]